MTLKEAIEWRVSCRNYTGEAIDSETVSALQNEISAFSQKAGVNIQLIQNQPGVLDAGRFNGAKDFFLLAGRGGDPDAGEKLGYYGEFLALEAVSRGLGTCWVTGTYNGRAIRAGIAGNERVFCVIALGKAQGGPQIRETVLGKVSHRTSKPLEELYTALGAAPRWFIRGMDAVQKAPSAMNTQPVHFSCKGGTVRGEAIQPGRSLDLGIAKAHFAIGAGEAGREPGENCPWEWGNGGALRRDFQGGAD
jgi:nitroreductase